MPTKTDLHPHPHAKYPSITITLIIITTTTIAITITITITTTSPHSPVLCDDDVPIDGPIQMTKLQRVVGCGE